MAPIVAMFAAVMSSMVMLKDWLIFIGIVRAGCRSIPLVSVPVRISPIIAIVGLGDGSIVIVMISIGMPTVIGIPHPDAPGQRHHCHKQHRHWPRSDRCVHTIWFLLFARIASRKVAPELERTFGSFIRPVT
jgi:hypothetical protein